MMHSFKQSLAKTLGYEHHCRHDNLHVQQHNASTAPPSPIDIIRYRYHYGVNLGSIYVLEKWLFNSAFPSTCTDRQTSELEAVKAWVEDIGLEATREKFETRYRNAIRDIDWDWLVNKGHVTSIRLPIGYFTLGPDFCHGTPFEPYSTVYRGAWNSVRSLVATAHSHGIGVLVDFHALPGGANIGDHSGTNSGEAALWNNTSNLDLSQKCIEFLAKEISGGSVVDAVGLQIINEAEYDAPGMYAFYDKIISTVSAIDPNIPLYISDGWDLPTAISYVKIRNKATMDSNHHSSCPVCIDTHLYFCFEDDDKSPQQIIAAMPDQLNEIDGHNGSVIDHGAVQVIVGEYACTLSEQTMSKIGGANQKEIKTEFGNAQCQRWQVKSGGSYFWTLKMDWMPGGDWGFVEQTNNGSTCPPTNLLLSAKEVRSILDKCSQQQAQVRDQSYRDHVTYWTKTAPTQTFDHEKFRQGYYLGWNDALTFFSARANGSLQGSASGGDKIGMLDLWVRKRILDTGVSGSFVWEFEVGLRKAVADFYQVAGV